MVTLFFFAASLATPLQARDRNATDLLRSVMGALKHPETVDGAPATADANPKAESNPGQTTKGDVNSAPVSEEFKQEQERRRAKCLAQPHSRWDQPVISGTKAPDLSKPGDCWTTI